MRSALFRYVHAFPSCLLCLFLSVRGYSYSVLGTAHGSFELCFSDENFQKQLKPNTRFDGRFYCHLFRLFVLRFSLTYFLGNLKVVSENSCWNFILLLIPGVHYLPVYIPQCLADQVFWVGAKFYSWVSAAVPSLLEDSWR